MNGTSALRPEPVPRPEWTALDDEGCRNVEGKVLLLDDELVIALLRFDQDGQIDEPGGDHETTVICLAGAGFTSVENERSPLLAGQRVIWPAGKAHRLWTVDTEMMTLMVERRA